MITILLHIFSDTCPIPQVPHETVARGSSDQLAGLNTMDRKPEAGLSQLTAENHS